MRKNELPELEQAAQLLREAEQRNVEECWKEIASVLEKFDCTMLADTIIRGNEVRQRVLILPKSAASQQPPLQGRMSEGEQPK